MEERNEILGLELLGLLGCFVLFCFVFALLSALDMALKNVSGLETGIILKDNPLPHHAHANIAVGPVEIQSKNPRGTYHGFCQMLCPQLSSALLSPLPDPLGFSS